MRSVTKSQHHHAMWALVSAGIAHLGPVSQAEREHQPRRSAVSAAERRERTRAKKAAKAQRRKNRR